MFSRTAVRVLANGAGNKSHGRSSGGNAQQIDAVGLNEGPAPYWLNNHIVLTNISSLQPYRPYNHIVLTTELIGVGSSAAFEAWPIYFSAVWD